MTYLDVATLASIVGPIPRVPRDLRTPQVQPIPGLARGTKTATVAAVKHLLATDEGWMTWAILRLEAEQTAAEQAAHQTTESNARGFNKLDAGVMTHYARLLRKNGKLYYWTRASKKLPKYAGQLLRLEPATVLHCLKTAAAPVFTAPGN